jgi:hypothetical protein
MFSLWLPQDLKSCMNLHSPPCAYVPMERLDQGHLQEWHVGQVFNLSLHRGS